MVSCIFIAALGVLLETATPAERSLVERDEALDRSLAAVRSAAELREKTSAFQAAFRERVGSEGIDRSPIEAQVVSQKEYEGFRIEKLLFESAPGSFVTGLLFLPDPTRYKPPYAAFLFNAGHYDEGKAAEPYLAICALAARNGLAAFIIDPLGQGERLQGADLSQSRLKCAAEHARIGHYAALLGKTTATYMIRDAVRALDVLCARPDIDSRRLAAAGHSGGATLTTFLSVVEPRLAAVAACCYLSSTREILMAVGPQDAEQNFFDEPSFGFNHAMMLLSNERPFLIAAARRDFFPLAGTRATFELVTNVAARCTLPADRYSLFEAEGAHALPRESREAIVSFFLRRLSGMVADVREENLPCLSPADCRVTPEGAVAKLPGFRSVYSELETELTARARRFASGELKAAKIPASGSFVVSAEKRGWRSYYIGLGEAWAVELYLAGLLDPTKVDPTPFLPRLAKRDYLPFTEFCR